MRTEIVKISPEMASEMLRLNTGNRKLRKRTVSFYAKQMRLGKWEITHQGIAISSTGRLLDGQHRLSAIIEAGVSVTMAVSTLESEDSFRCIDIGTGRDASDITGIKRQNVALVKLIAKTASSSHGAVSVSEVERIYTNNTEIVDFVCNHDTQRGFDSTVKMACSAYLFREGDTFENRLKVTDVHSRMKNGISTCLSEGLVRTIHKIETEKGAYNRSTLDIGISVFYGLIKSTKITIVNDQEKHQFHNVIKSMHETVDSE